MHIIWSSISVWIFMTTGKTELLHAEELTAPSPHTTVPINTHGSQAKKPPKEDREDIS